MPYFERFDICEAYLALEWNWHKGGWLRERPSCLRRMESIDVQLTRIGFKPGMAFCGYDSLTENGRAIYDLAERRLGLTARLPGYYDCGICGALHCADWRGDCREDSARFDATMLDEKHGADGWQEINAEDLPA